MENADTTPRRSRAGRWFKSLLLLTVLGAAYLYLGSTGRLPSGAPLVSLDDVAALPAHVTDALDRIQRFLDTAPAAPVAAPASPTVVADTPPATVVSAPVQVAPVQVAQPADAPLPPGVAPLPPARAADPIATVPSQPAPAAPVAPPPSVGVAPPPRTTDGDATGPSPSAAPPVPVPAHPGTAEYQAWRQSAEEAARMHYEQMRRYAPPPVMPPPMPYGYGYPPAGTYPGYPVQAPPAAPVTRP